MKTAVKLDKNFKRDKELQSKKKESANEERQGKNRNLFMSSNANGHKFQIEMKQKKRKTESRMLDLLWRSLRDQLFKKGADAEQHTGERWRKTRV